MEKEESVEKLEPTEEPENQRYSDEQFIEAARSRYGSDGEIEIDPGAIVSRGEDPGAYVAAWVWVRNIDIEADDEDDEA